ncbi:MAG TPA: NAD(P)/FAD-dependent oxidoreductase [Flavobacteriales bacterium]|jgi:predicted Rossmann fold flavoprotein|nr:NAD(P)/FAD-dependent oxidoreductase [Flavobacteriales bacterium]MBP8878175.1 NAD(P)/FAD-dependent oxidoreductase [Flavobacteriales bacterium]HQW05176.1 NAD(P)/FAD-dependent oxidoreductase [Flavobacteriales bacterium]HQW98977.1 NAD(P)/FAD-dependent oxidoreductase [Flavobacteriales bacterium]
MEVAVIGGGAAGFFAAISAAHHHPHATITIHEKTDKLLSKVRISGGGRCNVTHHQLENRKLAKHYPRGERFLRKAFERFAVKDTIAWFETQGVALKVEPDGRMFPTTDDSKTITTALLGAAEKAGVRIALHSSVSRIERDLPHGGYVIHHGPQRSVVDRVIVTTGGHPKASGYSWLAELGHTVVPPAPSLFTFNLPNDPIRELMGVAVPAKVRIGTNAGMLGPVLITHWGLSGPAVLRLSAWEARQLQEVGYRCTVHVNWLGERGEEEARAAFTEHDMDRKHAQNADPFDLPDRLWCHQLQKAGIALEKPWGEVGKRNRNRLIDRLINDRFEMEGKTTYKEEFVTAGGIALEEVDPRTMQSRLHRGLYFAGEILDIDGVTGGFNFQAAWTTGHIAGRLEG